MVIFKTVWLFGNFSDALVSFKTITAKGRIIDVTRHGKIKILKKNLPWRHVLHIIVNLHHGIPQFYTGFFFVGVFLIISNPKKNEAGATSGNAHIRLPVCILNTYIYRTIHIDYYFYMQHITENEYMNSFLIYYSNKQMANVFILISWFKYRNSQKLSAEISCLD